MASLDHLDMPFLVVAEEQSAGRGRGSKAWWSAPGALTFSAVLDARSHGLQPTRFPLVSLAAGLAVCEALRDVVPGAAWQLKWPNDVFLNGRKASGLLVEVPGIRPGRMVVGIGINVNNSLDSAPTELQSIATSLVDATGSPQGRTDVLIGVLQRLDLSLAQLADDEARLLERWRELCLLTGRTVLVRSGVEEALGRCRGIDDQGALLLETPAGLQRIASGVVAQFD
jgi:BirA family biotin operon repressor/biotin-[acetyl-CoA-carboxylase] ligase